MAWTNYKGVNVPDVTTSDAGTYLADDVRTLADRTVFTATADPTADDDDTAGFATGSLWLNTSTLQLWQCITAATGTAVWSQVIQVANGSVSFNTPIAAGTWNGTPIALADGGTGATTAVGACDDLHTKSTNIASAATTDLSTATGISVDITGTTTITSFGTCNAGVLRFLRFTGSLTLTYNATSLILPGGANITTAAGDTTVFESLGSGNWQCVSYQPASGQSLFGGAPVIQTIAYASTITPVGSNPKSIVNVGTLTGNLIVAAPSGTVVDGYELGFRFVQDATGGRIITWNGIFAFGTDITTMLIPTAANSKWEMKFIYNATDSKWRALALARGF